MLCPFCGAYADGDAILCPECGRLLPRGENRDTGVRAIRQGRRAREDAAAQRTPLQAERQGAGRVYVDPEHLRAQGEVPVYADSYVYDEEGQPVTGAALDEGARGYAAETMREPGAYVNPDPRGRLRKEHLATRRMVNWTLVGLIAIGFAVILAIGALIFLNRTHAGQLIMARSGRSATSAALWEVGEERMDTGDIDGAIACFEQAALQDEEADDINVPGLLMLGGAYEAAGRLEDAEALYVHIYTDIVPSAPTAYSNVIRMMLSDGRRAAAAELMQTAWEKTGLSSFQQQRTDLLPQQPVVSRTAGSFSEKFNLGLTSPQGLDVYYTFDEEAVLPDEGILCDGSVFMDEGTRKLRAVCVNGDLVSDELSATYSVSLPRPQSPYVHLAPNTYKTRCKVPISPGKENSKDTDITIYYTIDGSIPDSDSPIYDGTPVQLPTGYVTLRAVAVNGYGKSSNVTEVNYKIDVRPYPKAAFGVEDLISGMKLHSTEYTDFQAAYGEPLSQEDLTLNNISNPCRKYVYGWGYAIFERAGSHQYLVDLYFTGGPFSAPRSTGVGQSESEITDAYRDMGQKAGGSGNRGLYQTDKGIGRVLVTDTGKIIRYICYTADSHTWQLDYVLNSYGVVTAIETIYIP
ncbi:MAG: chitobiase/beta-hexosaminidase C-terminal domain-containing protein [Clostridia bacterium]|nr:chitobiase/beta-hexosaminidase C-terminal domain-containing protein [Clostridia bacterium]